LSPPLKEALLSERMQTRPLTKADFDRIVTVIDAWWGGPTTALAHPIFFYELGQLARVVEEDGDLVGFLFGFIAETETRMGYVHLVGIHPDHRRRGVARLLYAAFEEDCRDAGCGMLKAITTHGDDGSVRFHQALGWKTEDVPDYAGRGRSRVVFQKRLSSGRLG
jgi:GNAT superfamily N-acetyltransferase